MADKRQELSQEFADKVIKALENGTAPWIKPWEPGELSPPFNPVSGTIYKGMNFVNLNLALDGNADPRWLTLKQANDSGWKVKKGSKSQPVIYWNFHKVKQDMEVIQDGKPMLDEKGNTITEKVEVERPFLRIARVFHASQVEGIPKWDGREITWNANERAETILANSGAALVHDQADKAFYRPSTDKIHLPGKAAFPNEEKYYSTALHEKAHWTGHSSRLDRGHAPFGTEDYAREELRAEMASWMLCTELGLGHDPEQHVAYIGSWIKVLKEDPMEILRAARDAERIKEYSMAYERGKNVHKGKAMPEEKVEKAPERLAEKKTYLTVPFKEKERAKAGGARWDRKKKLWFVPEGGDLNKVTPWLPEKQRMAPATSTLSPQVEFGQALKEAGLDLKGELPVMDGQMHRVPLLDGKANSRDGAYKGFLDGHPAGFIQNHKTGFKENWKATGHRLTEDQKQSLKAEAQQRKDERDKELLEQRSKASKKAFAMWKNARGWANHKHPYLANKGVKSFGVKVDPNGNLLIPGRDAGDFIHTIQTVTPDGEKRFLKGGRKSGTMHTIDPDNRQGLSPILVVEGYATGASVHMATGLPVHVAFDASNLESVAKALHKKHPEKPVIVVGDNDHTLEHKGKGNVGVIKAQAAAKAVNGLFIAPFFNREEYKKGLTDYNDLHASRGLEEVAGQLAPALAKAEKRIQELGISK